MFNSKFDKLFNTIMQSYDLNSPFSHAMDNYYSGPDEEYGSDDLKQALDWYEDSIYFTLKFLFDNKYIIVFKAKVQDVSTGDYNIQICNITPDLSFIKVINFNTLEDVTNNISDTQMKQIKDTIVNECNHFTDEALNLPGSPQLQQHIVPLWAYSWKNLAVTKENEIIDFLKTGKIEFEIFDGKRFTAVKCK